MRYIGIMLISLYQHTLSPDHGPFRRLFKYGFCRFEPTCSEYTKQALKKHGSIKGGLMGFWRIIRCNPWNHGGEDPVK